MTLSDIIKEANFDEIKSETLEHMTRRGKATAGELAALVGIAVPSVCLQFSANSTRLMFHLCTEKHGSICRRELKYLLTYDKGV